MKLRGRLGEARGGRGVSWPIWYYITKNSSWENNNEEVTSIMSFCRKLGTSFWLSGKVLQRCMHMHVYVHIMSISVHFMCKYCARMLMVHAYLCTCMHARVWISLLANAHLFCAKLKKQKQKKWNFYQNGVPAFWPILCWRKRDSEHKLAAAKKSQNSLGSKVWNTSLGW